MKLSGASFLPLAVKLGEYLIAAVDHVAMLRASGVSVSPDIVAVWLATRMEAWSPCIGGRVLLDTETRFAAARFLAGVGFNLAGKE